MTALIRCCFVALIVLVLASQTIRADRDREASNPTAAVVERLGKLGVQTTRTPSGDILVGRSPRCEHPIAVTLLTTSGAEDEAKRKVSGADVVVKSVYLGSVGESPSRTMMMGRWVWATFLFDIGLRADKPSNHLVMLALPRSCAGLTAIDWSVLSP